MKSVNFITNINCSSCVNAITPTLNELVGEDNWVVDTSNQDKILTVFSENIVIDDIISSVKGAGYEIKPIINNN